MARRRNRGKPGFLPLKIVLLILVLAVIAYFYVGMIRQESRQKRNSQTRGDYRLRYAYGDVIEVDGVRYRRKSNITTVLLMGIDRDAAQEKGQGFRNGGQADFLRLLVIDDQNDRVAQLQIDRDTMTPIVILGVLGNRSGIRTAQISLSHGFGDGQAQSCELTVEAVSNLLLDLTIDHYAALDLDGLTVLNDVVGGVTVTVEDDMSELDPMMTAGTTLTLRGAQAEYFVRSRMMVGDGTNVSRMRRQEQYISSLIQQLRSREQLNESFAGTVYDALEPYMVTDLSRGRMINTVWSARSYEYLPLITLQGEHTTGRDGFTQFHVDEDALKETVIDLVYDKVG